jgi:hypothetical protein
MALSSDECCLACLRAINARFTGGPGHSQSTGFFGRCLLVLIINLPLVVAMPVTGDTTIWLFLLQVLSKLLARIASDPFGVLAAPTTQYHYSDIEPSLIFCLQNRGFPSRKLDST